VIKLFFKCKYSFVDLSTVYYNERRVEVKGKGGRGGKRVRDREKLQKSKERFNIASVALSCPAG
jgi:hypothetical protein